MSDPSGRESEALERAQEVWREISEPGPSSAPADTGRGLLRRVRNELLLWCLLPAALPPLLALVVYFLISLLASGGGEVQPFVYAN